jgi:hypothetical protein
MQKEMQLDSKQGFYQMLTLSRNENIASLECSKVWLERATETVTSEVDEHELFAG